MPSAWSRDYTATYWLLNVGYIILLYYDRIYIKLMVISLLIGYIRRPRPKPWPGRRLGPPLVWTSPKLPHEGSSKPNVIFRKRNQTSLGFSSLALPMVYGRNITWPSSPNFQSHAPGHRTLLSNSKSSREPFCCETCTLERWRARSEAQVRGWYK